MKEMYNLYQLATEALDNLNAIGIYPHVTPNNFTVNTRALKRFGQAQYKTVNGVKVYSINIASFLLDKRNEEKNVMQTIYHECIHCCDGCMCHTGEWKRLAELVNDCYAMDISRLGSSKEILHEDVYKERMEKLRAKTSKRIGNNTYKYHCYCEECGYEITRIYSRAPKWYHNIRNFHCPICHESALNTWREKV
jgi:hypothetical protein